MWRVDPQLLSTQPAGQSTLLQYLDLQSGFATLLAQAGISPRVAMELMRHSDMRLTAKTYTDVMNLPLFGELEKLSPVVPSLIASLNCEKAGPKTGNSDQSELQKKWRNVS